METRCAGQQFAHHVIDMSPCIDSSVDIQLRRSRHVLGEQNAVTVQIDAVVKPAIDPVQGQLSAVEDVTQVVGRRRSDVDGAGCSESEVGIVTKHLVNAFARENSQIGVGRLQSRGIGNLDTVTEDQGRGQRIQRPRVHPTEIGLLIERGTLQIGDCCRLKESRQTLERAAGRIGLDSPSLGAHRRDRLEDFDRVASTVKNQIAIDVCLGSGRNLQFRMIEGCSFPTNALIGECFEESNQRRLAVRMADQEWHRKHLGCQCGQVVGGKVASSGVEIHDLLEGRITAAMEVRTGQFDIAQRRCLEGTCGADVFPRLWRRRQQDRARRKRQEIVVVGIIRIHRSDLLESRRHRESMSKWIHATSTDVVLCLGHTKVVEASIVDGQLEVLHRHPLEKSLDGGCFRLQHDVDL